MVVREGPVVVFRRLVNYWVPALELLRLERREAVMLVAGRSMPLALLLPESGEPIPVMRPQVLTLVLLRVRLKVLVLGGPRHRVKRRGTMLEDGLVVLRPLAVNARVQTPVLGRLCQSLKVLAGRKTALGRVLLLVCWMKELALPPVRR